jgi:hypothetical protein
MITIPSVPSITTVSPRVKTLGDLVDLDLHRTLGIDPRPCDALVYAPHQA